MGQQILVTFIGFLGIAHAGVLAHGPEASAIHGGLHAASEGKLAGIAYILVILPALKIARQVHGLRCNGLQIASLSFGFCIVSHCWATKTLLPQRPQRSRAATK